MSNKIGELKREIGFLGLSSNIINIVIGSGIFVLPAIVAADLGAASILAYVFCGILITLIMLCFAEVGSKITETGGVYIYFEKTFGKYAGFLAACIMLLASITGVGAVANAVISVIFRLFPFLQSEIIRISFFLLLFSGLGYINVIGLKKGVGFVKIITFIKIAPLLLIVFWGFKDIEISNLVWEITPSINEIGTTSLILFFAFTGAGSALSVSGEVRNPQRTIPRAILFSVFIVGIIYVLVQTVAQGVLGSSLPSYIENPLGEVANQIFGPVGFGLLTVGAAVSMFGTISSFILSIPRILFAASKDNVIPIKLLSKVHSKYVTPYVSIIVFSAFCFIFSCFGGFQELAILSSASTLIIALGMSIAPIKLRRRKKIHSRDDCFKIPGGLLVPILSIIVIIWFLSNLSSNKIIALGLFFGVLSILYFLMNYKSIMNLGKGD
ncbi:MAG: amino acid permease [Bacteroidetes bacterium]|nr:MAG: amino acid permease [Bacteroidota bacterium]